MDSGRLYKQASEAARQHDSQRAVELADQLVERDPKFAPAYYLRGREHFRLGQVDKSLADFNRFLELRPQQAAAQWERGISLYYAAEFREGARQFSACQAHYAEDVENAVWRYLCVARTDGVEEARKGMLRVDSDRRVPMMDIYRMFRGQTTPDQVLQAAESGRPSAEALAGRRFYAHLYIGLFYHAAGDEKPARKYILLAADPKNKDAAVNRYMWDVARIHAQRSQAATSKDQPSR